MIFIHKGKIFKRRNDSSLTVEQKGIWIDVLGFFDKNQIYMNGNAHQIFQIGSDSSLTVQQKGLWIDVPAFYHQNQIQMNGHALVQLNESSVQVNSIISKKNNLIVKLYAPSIKANIKVKYFPLEGRSQQKTRYLLNALQNIAYGFRKNQYEGSLDFHINFERIEKHIVVESRYIESNNLEKVLMHPTSSQGKDLYNIFMSKLPALLLDAFLDCLDLNTLIINESNLFIQPHDLVINTISFVGTDLVVFEEDISMLEFRSIYNFIDSKIFERPAQDRIGHHMQKLKNFAALLLTFIMNSQIRILENIKIPEIVTIDFAKDLMKQSPKLFEKYLKIKYVQKQIKQKADLWKLKYLGDFLRKILVQEREMSWGEIKQYLCSQANGDHSLAKKIHFIASELWVRLQTPIREYFYNKRIVSIVPSSTSFDTNYELFMIFMMNKRVSSLKQGCLMQEYADDRQYDFQSKDLFTQFAAVINEIIEKPVLLRQQSYEVNVRDIEQSYLVIVNNIHRRILMQAQAMPYEPQRSLYSSNSDTSYENAVRPSQLAMEYDFEEAQEKAQSLPEEMRDLQGLPMTKEEMFKELYNLASVKLSNSFEAKGKQVRVEHDMLQCLKSYESAFR